MNLLNAAVAVASAVVGTVGATVAYGTLNTPPADHTKLLVEPAIRTRYLPCEPPSELTDGVCLTTVVRTVVKTAEPKVITTVERSRSTGKGSTSRETAARDDDHEDEDDHEEDHEDEDEDEEDHEDEDD